MSAEISIRKAVAEDISRVKALEMECELSPWSEADYLNELNLKDSIFLVTELNFEIIGFLVARLIMNQTIVTNSFEDSFDKFIELLNFGIGDKNKKNGFGKLLLESLINKSKDVKAEYIFLEVRKSNVPAISLYTKLGFEQIYERKNLYRNPEENGFGMKLEILQNIELDMN